MEIEVGCVYRVNHTKCPKSSPLHSINSLLVKKKSNEQVTVVFPSKKSVDKFYSVDKMGGAMQPNLDENIVMGFNAVNQILTQKISFEEFAIQRGNKSFWVYDENSHDVRWETRRRTKVYTRRKPTQINDVGVVEVSCDDDDECVKKKKKVEIVESVVGKRKCRLKGVVYSDKKMMKKKRKVVSSKASNITDSRHRWTTDRYKQAEMNLFKIMKEKGTGPYNTLLRPDLRAEARKLIGDTGLLDHLLKHVAGKLAPGGKERFCRRHNPQGAMEYWLESSDLAQVRKKAGVDDPFWVPPTGWKPGDCPNQDPSCALQLKDLREEVYNMKREIQMISSSRGQENSQMLIEDAATPDDAVERQTFEESAKPLEGMFEELMKKKAYIENQLSDFSKCLIEVEEEIARVKESAVPSTEAMLQNAEKQTAGMSEDPKEQNKVASPPSTEAISQNAEKQTTEKSEGSKEQNKVASPPSTEAISQIAEKQTTEKSEGSKEEDKVGSASMDVSATSLKSGFRMCQPEGSFLWPSEVATSSMSMSLASKTRSLMLAPSALAPRPVIRKPVAKRAGVRLAFSTAIVRGSTTIESIACPNIASFSSVHNLVPDLNQFPLF